jgi:hypothetical protein
MHDSMAVVSEGPCSRDACRPGDAARAITIDSIDLESAEKQNVNVSAKTHVVGQVPTNVVWILVNDDLVTIPEPISAIAQVVGSDAEKEAAKPEAARTAAFKMEHMIGTKRTLKMPVLPRMVEAIVRVTTASLMSDPLAIVVNVGRFGMSGPVIEYVTFGDGTLSITDRGWATSGNAPAADLLSIVGVRVPVLRDAEGVNGS